MFPSLAPSILAQDVLPQDESARTATDWIPAVLIVLTTALLILAVRWLIRRTAKDDRSETHFREQVAAVSIVLLGLVTIIFVLPDDSDSNLAFSVVGLVVTGALAISSQSIIANAMAGLMLRSVSSFKPGDFIEVGGQMGRVSELGLFHTEIQSADRDLVTLPNSLMMNQPVRVVRSSGTIVSATVSIGYDVSRHRLEDLFVKAAEAADLLEPYVQVVDLGDYSVNYRVAGFLEDPRNLLASRSQLQGSILDTLSEAGVEIMSPMYIARRAVTNEPVLGGDYAPSIASEIRPSAEDRVFDKAEAAGRMEETRAELADANENLELLKLEVERANEETLPRVQAAVTRQEMRIERLSNRIDMLKDQHEED